MRELARFGLFVLLARAIFAQAGDSAPGFAAADIHASGPNTMPEMRRRFARGRYELTNATMVDLIRTAWGVDADKVVGGPDWLDIRRFDVIASAPAGTAPETLSAMLRKLLADRFQLAAHRDTRGVPAYAMSATGKPQLKQAEGSEAAGCDFEGNRNPPRGGTVLFKCRNMTMASFAGILPGVREASGYLFGYRVVDRTGLKGSWDFSLKWTPRVARLARPVAGEPVTLFDALEKQVGLKLSPIHMNMPVVVVDSVSETPTPNPPGVTEKAPVRLEFEVAEIKPDPLNERGSSVSIQPGGLVRINMTLKGLIQEAWEDYARSDRIVGATKRMENPFEVIAKAPAQEDAVAGWNGPVWNGVDVDSMRKMLRALLAERFGLVTHYEDRLVIGYELVAANPKLRKADPANRAGCREGPGADGRDPRPNNPLVSRLVTCRNMTMAQFAAELNGDLMGLPPVVDATGIVGRYDMTVSFSPPAAFQNTGVPAVAAGDGVASEPNGAITLADALRNQLGLKLQTRKVMAPVLVIDHVNEMPTEN
jgi:uncharacterized protein (TIGR03435 family)